MRRKVAAIFGLLGFAAVALLAALRNGDFAHAVPRAILAALAMAAVGYVCGAIAEKAVREAVDTKMPPYKPLGDGHEGPKDTARTEEE